MSRFRCHLFVCTNQRKPDDARGCCTSRGSAAILEALKARAHAAGLKGSVRVNKAGCLDACEFGVSMVVYPQGAWYGRVTAADVDEIVERTLQRGEIIERLVTRFDPPRPAS
ncbi:MAG: (2Fe-2S) ferredoxin domain-containing protein [Planctomycetota bacterium]